MMKLIPGPLAMVRARNRLLGRLAPGAAVRAAADDFLRPRRLPVPERERLGPPGERLGFDGLSAVRFGRGRPVLAIHGWEGRATQFAAWAEPLGAAGLSLIGLDGPAHGESEGDEANPLAFAEAMLRADAAHGPFAGVVGHSMGGSAVVIAMARGLRAERCVLVAAPASLEGVFHRYLAAVGVPLSLAPRFAAEVGRRAGAPADQVRIERLAATLRAPALVVHCRDDREVPFAEAESMAACWPGATLLARRGVGHRRILRDAETISAVARFLAASA
jgi:pimeloyl-ACP methyl ester carboxylesterase